MTRTLSNGYTYQVVENFLGGYSMYFKGANSDKFSRSTKSFRSLNEAEEWFETWKLTTSLLRMLRDRTTTFQMEHITALQDISETKFNY